MMLSSNWINSDVENEIKICSSCFVDSGLICFGKFFAGEEPEPCDVCGKDFWSLLLAAQPRLAPDATPKAQSEKSENLSGLRG